MLFSPSYAVSVPQPLSSGGVRATPIASGVAIGKNGGKETVSLSQA